MDDFPPVVLRAGTESLDLDLVDDDLPHEVSAANSEWDDASGLPPDVAESCGDVGDDLPLEVAPPTGATCGQPPDVITATPPTTTARGRFTAHVNSISDMASLRRIARIRPLRVMTEFSGIEGAIEGLLP